MFLLVFVWIAVTHTDYNTVYFSQATLIYAFFEGSIDQSSVFVGGA